jgi:hypothetical protein
MLNAERNLEQAREPLGVRSLLGCFENPSALDAGRKSIYVAKYILKFLRPARISRAGLLLGGCLVSVGRAVFACLRDESRNNDDFLFWACFNRAPFAVFCAPTRWSCII